MTHILKADPGCPTDFVCNWTITIVATGLHLVAVQVVVDVERPFELARGHGLPADNAEPLEAAALPPCAAVIGLAAKQPFLAALRIGRGAVTDERFELPVDEVVDLLEINTSLQILPGDVPWTIQRRAVARDANRDAQVRPTTSRAASTADVTVAALAHGRTSR